MKIPHCFYKWNFTNLKAQKISRGLFLIESCTQLFMILTSCFSKDRLPDTDINKDYSNNIKFMKITSNSTNNRQERQKEQNDESFPKKFFEITTL